MSQRKEKEKGIVQRGRKKTERRIVGEGEGEGFRCTQSCQSGLTKPCLWCRNVSGGITLLQLNKYLQASFPAASLTSSASDLCFTAFISQPLFSHSSHTDAFFCPLRSHPRSAMSVCVCVCL